MDSITSKLSQILESPEGMEQVRSLADQIFGGGDTPDLSKIMSMLPNSQAGQSDSKKPTDPSPDLSIPPEQMGTIIKAMQLMNSGEDDDRTRLLLALKPHLSPKRRERVDRAVKLLKLAKLMPLISQSGIFKL